MATNNAANYSTGASATVLTGNGVAVTPTFQAPGLGAIPFFEAYSSAGASNVTGDGTTATIIFDTVTANVGGYFDTSTYTFTAPFSGNYQFNISITATNVPVITALASYSAGFNLGQVVGGCAANASPTGQQTYTATFAVFLPATTTINGVLTVSIPLAIVKTVGYLGGRGPTSFSGYFRGT